MAGTPRPQRSLHLAVLLATLGLVAAAAPALAAGTGLSAAVGVPSVPAPDLLGDGPTGESDHEAAGEHEEADEPLDDHAATSASPGVLDRLAGAAWALPGALMLMAGATLFRIRRPPRPTPDPRADRGDPEEDVTGEASADGEPFLAEGPPGGVEGVLRVAQAYLDRGDYEPAAEWFATASELAPKRPTPHFCRAVCFEELDRLDDAMAAYAAAREAGAGATPIYRQARLIARDGRPREALTPLRRALDEEPALIEDAAGDEAFDALRDHPRFLALVGKL